jgi:hypothetical protein
LTVATPPDVLKYIHDEPTLLEPLTPDGDPDARRREDRSAVPEERILAGEDPFDTQEAYRGYLAGANRADDRVGLTTLRDPHAYVAPLRAALGRAWWGRVTSEGASETLDADGVRETFVRPEHTSVLVTADAPVPTERMAAVAGRAPRRAIPALQSLLDAAHVAFFPESAHDGHDWSFFSAVLMCDRLVAAFRDHPTDRVRRFVVPYRHARSESSFYFDQWQLTASPLPDSIEEV